MLRGVKDKPTTACAFDTRLGRTPANFSVQPANAYASPGSHRSARATDHDRPPTSSPRSRSSAGSTGASSQRFADLTREKFYPRGSVILFEDDPGDSLFVVRAGPREGRAHRRGRPRSHPRRARRRRAFRRAVAHRRPAALGARDRDGRLAPARAAPRGLPTPRRVDARASRGRCSPSCRAACAAPTRRSAASCCSTCPAASRGCCSTSPRRAGSDTIEKPLTHQTIAQMIGASRETVSRAMKDFQDANWVDRRAAPHHARRSRGARAARAGRGCDGRARRWQ